MNLNAVQTGGLLQLAIEASPNGILLIDARGTIALVNRAAEHQFGYSRAELVGRGVEDLLPEAIDGVRAAQNEAGTLPLNADAPEKPAAALGLRQDGSRFAVELRLKPIRTPDVTCVLATVIDRNSTESDRAAQRAAAEAHFAFEQLAYGGRALHGVKVSGVELSGFSRSEAIARIDALQSERRRAPLTVTIRDQKFGLDPRLVSLEIDVVRTRRGQSDEPEPRQVREHARIGLRKYVQARAVVPVKRATRARGVRLALGIELGIVRQAKDAVR